MANTTNYNWETPDDTDLVKDGAAAIRTLGNSVDTTTKALNPETTLGDIAYRSATSNTNTRLPIGTSGQILAVSAGVPAWINNDQGDITEVAAGTGISVASGTGPVPTVSINTAVTADLTTAQTLTNKTLTSPVLTTPTISTIDAKGDLLVGTADNTIGRLAVGTNTYILTADSAETTGLKWAAPAGGGFTFAAYTPTYTNFTLGNGTVIARYAESGKLVFFQVQITFGSTTSVSGLIKISLPVTAKNNGNAVTIPALFTDAGLNEYIGFGAINQTDNVVSLFADDASATYLKYALTSSTVPFTWGTADVINVSGSYEAN